MNFKNIDSFKIFYRKGTSDEFVIKEAFDDRIFEKGFPEYQPQKKDLVLDIGAHIGTYSLQLSQQITMGLIHAFEPCLETFDYLEKNVTGNGVKNIKMHKIALSDNVGNTKLYYDIENGNWGHSIVKNFSPAGEIVGTTTLSNFFEVNNIQNCDFIKFNCEGAEFKILLSTPISVLKKIKKMLVLYHMDLSSDHTVEDLISHLKGADFYTEIRQKSFDGKRGWLIVIRTSALGKVGLSLKSGLKRSSTFLKTKAGSLLRRIINASKKG
jgi:FkbM family methyltransferase